MKHKQPKHNGSGPQTAGTGLDGAMYPLLTEEKFTDAFLTAAQDAGLPTEVHSVEPLRVTSGTSVVLLRNAYRKYRMHPSSLDTILNDTVAHLLDRPISPLSADLIIPLLKAAGILDSSGPFGAKYGYVATPYNTELVTIYGQNNPFNIVHISERDLAPIGQSREALHLLAMDNLRRSVPPPRKHQIDGNSGIFVLDGADNTPITGFLLLDEYWSDFQGDVAGDLVLAAPSENLLVLTGSHNGGGVAWLRERVPAWYRRYPHPLSDRLFVRRTGRFEVLGATGMCRSVTRPSETTAK